MAALLFLPTGESRETLIHPSFQFQRELPSAPVFSRLRVRWAGYAPRMNAWVYGLRKLAELRRTYRLAWEVWEVLSLSCILNPTTDHLEHTSIWTYFLDSLFINECVKPKSECLHECWYSTTSFDSNSFHYPLRLHYSEFLPGVSVKLYCFFSAVCLLHRQKP